MTSFLINASQEESQWACISELASQLACVTNVGGDTEDKSPISKPYYTCLLRDPRLYTFSNQLIQALLHHESKVDNRNIHQLLSILKRESKRITQALDRSSLRCLAYLLLNSDVDNGLKNGIYLLLDEPQYMRDSGHMVYQVASPRIEDRPRLLQRRILSKLYLLFSTEGQATWLRKLAGKMFLEILSEPEHNDAFFLESEEVELSRLSYVILNGNCTLKLLATIMIHALHNSGVSDEALWKSDSSTDRVRFFDTLPSYRNDPLQHFYTLSNMAVVSEVVDKTSYLRRCFLLQSLHIDETPLFEGTVLAIIDEGCLTFITYRQNTTRMCLEYVDFYTQSIGLPVRTVVDKSMIYCLKLVLSQNKLVVKNGRRLCFEGHVLSILSDKDPGDLRNAIEAFCQNDQGSINTDGIFRTSSMVMELDTSDEVARKSSGISPNNTQGQEGPRTGPILIQKSVKELEKHSEELEKCNTTNANLDDVHLEHEYS
ncbi:hypothetical protein CBS115989_817 [Aspergillus niger]|nr:hypothetical protein CBS115989_817 [Aspergillus niger]KAI2879357.1 hypothetical protein CBS115988_2513 [Aspergillus niger]